MPEDPKDRSACTLNALRTATRNTARLFDSALAAVELRSTQFTMLTMIEAYDGSPINELARILAMDRTTLTRNLKPLESRKLVRSATDEDKRVRRIHITPAGQKLLAAASPIWQRTQLDLVGKIGRDRWERLLEDLERVHGLVFSA